METVEQQINYDKVNQLVEIFNLIGSGNYNTSLLGEIIIQLAPPHITAKEIAAAEQRLINAGCPAETAGHLSATFVVIALTESTGGTVDLKTGLPYNHILRRIVAEHDMIRCFIADLTDVTAEIKPMNTLSITSSEFMRLCHIAQHLKAMEEHVRAEEDTIFPEMERHAWASLCRDARNDHSYITISIGDLLSIVKSFGKSSIKFNEFRAKLIYVSDYLCPTMMIHLKKEENTLFQIALAMIRDQRIWGRMKAQYDYIGYCGIHA